MELRQHLILLWNCVFLASSQHAHSSAQGLDVSMNAGWKSPSDTSYVGQQWGELDGTNNSDRGHNGDAEAHDVEQPQKKNGCENDPSDPLCRHYDGSPKELDVLASPEDTDLSPPSKNETIDGGPGGSPGETDEPSAAPSPLDITVVTPSSFPSTFASGTPTMVPTPVRSTVPSTSPTVVLSKNPTIEPTSVPLAPSAIPSTPPSIESSGSPSSASSNTPSIFLSMRETPTVEPSSGLLFPSATPTVLFVPSTEPPVSPSSSPTSSSAVTSFPISPSPVDDDLSKNETNPDGETRAIPRNTQIALAVCTPLLILFVILCALSYYRWTRDSPAGDDLNNTVRKELPFHVLEQIHEESSSRDTSSSASSNGLSPPSVDGNSPLENALQKGHSLQLLSIPMHTHSPTREYDVPYGGHVVNENVPHNVPLVPQSPQTSTTRDDSGFNSRDEESSSSSDSSRSSSTSIDLPPPPIPSPYSLAVDPPMVDDSGMVDESGIRVFLDDSTNS